MGGLKSLPLRHYTKQRTYASGYTHGYIFLETSVSPVFNNRRQKMANRVVALMLRANTLPKRPYLKPHTTANGTVRPLWAMHEGKPTHFPTGVYYLRFKQGPKLVFERIGPHLDEAGGQTEGRDHN